MSNFAQKDIDRHNEQHSLKTIDDDINEIGERIRTLTQSWQEIFNYRKEPDQRDVDRVNENTENAKREPGSGLYHQGDQEDGELMQDQQEEDSDELS